MRLEFEMRRLLPTALACVALCPLPVRAQSVEAAPHAAKAASEATSAGSSPRTFEARASAPVAPSSRRRDLSARLQRSANVAQSRSATVPS